MGTGKDAKKKPAGLCVQLSVDKLATLGQVKDLPVIFPATY